MSHTEAVQKAIKVHSEANVDDYIKVTSFQDEVADVSEAVLSFKTLWTAHRLLQAIRGHIHLEWKSWFFFRKLSADCARANVALHGFAM
jgi:ferritin heavy chain